MCQERYICLRNEMLVRSGGRFKGNSMYVVLENKGTDGKIRRTFALGWL